MIDRQQLEAFAAVIEHKSFERASVMLNITRSAVSQRIKSLEQSLSTILVVRERPITPTRSGRMLLRHVRALRLLESEVFEAIPGRHHSFQQVTIGIDVDSLTTWFEPLLSDLMRDLSLYIEVITDDRNHTLDLLARGDALGCVSPVARALEGFEAQPLGTMKYRCVASPNFAVRHFVGGMTVRAMLATPAILFNRQDTLHDTFLANMFGMPIDRYPRHYVPSSRALIAAVRAGAGYALVPAPHIAGLIESGALTDLTPDKSCDVDLFWHHWPVMPVVGQTLTAKIIKEARKKLHYHTPLHACAS